MELIYVLPVNFCLIFPQFSLIMLFPAFHTSPFERAVSRSDLPTA